MTRLSFLNSHPFSDTRAKKKVGLVRSEARPEAFFEMLVKSEVGVHSDDRSQQYQEEREDSLPSDAPHARFHQSPTVYRN